MRRLTRRLWNWLTQGTTPRSAARPRLHRRRLELEYLEDRTLLSANYSGVITGTAFLDSNANHVRNSGELGMAGVTVKLVGTTTGTSTAVSLTAQTNASGVYTFSNVMPGDYTVSAGPVKGLINGSTAATGSFTLDAGKKVTENLAFTGKLSPSAVSIAEFLTTSNGISYDFGKISSAATLANYRPDNAPVVSKALSPVAVTTSSSATTVDLAGGFTDPDMTNSIITFNITEGAKTLHVKMQLYDKQTPQTVANFFDYIKAHAYDNSIFHRLQKAGSGLEVLQGGAITVDNANKTFNTIPILTQGQGVPNEEPTKVTAARSNLFGTIAMAQSGGNVNSATDQFFFNTGNNAKALDKQNFVVFGKVLSVSDAALRTLANAPVPAITIPSSVQSQFPTVAFTDPSHAGVSVVPLTNVSSTQAANFNFPTDAFNANGTNDFLTINNITINKRDEWLTYSVVSNSNPSLVTPNVTNEWLTLNYTAGQTGTADIVIKATDRYGASVTQTLHVTVGSAPTVTNVAIAPNSTTNATTLTATPTSTDPQNLPVTYTYQWNRNGTAISGATGQTLTLSTVSSLAANDTITVTVTPRDSAPFTGSAFTSSAITVATVNPDTFKLPTVTGATITPDSASNTTTLTAAPTGTDPLNKTLTYTYHWMRNGTEIPTSAKVNNNTVQLPSVTTATLQLSDLTAAGITVNAGDTFAVEITPSDGVLTGAKFTSGTVKVGSVGPVVIVEPVVNSIAVNPDNASNATQLTAIPSGANPEGGTLSFTYQWFRTANGTNTPVAITGATSATLLLSSTTVNDGDQFTVQVTPFDGTIDGATVTSSAKTVATTTPGVTFA